MDLEGNLEMMSLLNLIQYLGQEGIEAMVTLQRGSQAGCIYLKHGLILHAESNPENKPKLVGDEAVYELMTWCKGRFKALKDAPTPELTIEKSWEFVLMEGLRIIDEARSNKS
ncbi:MAG: hypothetical protein ACI9EW_003904 [Cellvibrionaceae bacterium]|jgi:hypothetical protein